jgi:hypothetical protein
MKYGGWPMDLSAAGNNTDVKVFSPGKKDYTIPADAPVCNFYTMPPEFLNYRRLNKDRALAKKENSYIWIG